MFGAGYRVSLQINLQRLTRDKTLWRVSENFKGGGGGGGKDIWYDSEKCPRCKKHCSTSPKRYKGMPPKKLSKIQNEF